MFVNLSDSFRFRRRAYTLIEILVVIAIIGILSGIVMVMWPGLRGSQRTTNAADKIQTALLISKQMALRDQRPYGVRFETDPANANNIVNLVYIRQPEPYTFPAASLNAGTFGPSNPIANFTTGVGLDFQGGQGSVSDYTVQPGDFLEINGGGLVHPLALQPSLTTSPPYVMQTSLRLIDSFTVDQPTSQWRVIRQPRVVAGEEAIEWSQGIVVDLAKSRNVPARTNPYGGAPYYEILFAPSGRVIGQGVSSNDKILLYVTDSKAKPGSGEDLIVGVQIGSGFIGGYPVDKSTGPNADPYSNTHDPRAGGM